MDLLAQMEMFVRVVESKSLSAAARSVRQSLPAVSRQLRALEMELGTSLIARSTRRLSVTDAGREWYAHCIRVLRDVEMAKDSVRGGARARGTLVVSSSLTFGTAFVLPRLMELRSSHPELVIELRLEDRVVDLIGESVDVALRAGLPPPDSTAFVAHRLTTLRRRLVASPRWLRKHGSVHEPEQLAGRECLVQVALGGEPVRWALSRGSEQRTIAVQGHLRTNAPLALRTLAVDGLGIALLPDWLVQDDVAQNRLRPVLPEWSSPPIAVWAIHRAELRGNPRVRAFLEAIDLGDVE
jgi:DNA-binding transcriptional LysR family regulator